ncbi:MULTISPECIES: hypothetical protein [Listeria]|uniref:hypothetical protein n=1 Tax=Listeria TaxID=1637 RepID=UPI000AE6EF7E|nr:MULTISPECIES: hypothetical protein [Listeria]
MSTGTELLTTKMSVCRHAEDTALCPYCMIDSVLPESDILPLSREFLNDMHQQWFG